MCIYIYICIYIYAYIYIYIHIYIYISHSIMVIGAPYPNPQAENLIFNTAQLFSSPRFTGWCSPRSSESLHSDSHGRPVGQKMPFLPPRNPGNGNHITYKHGDGWGMIYDCFYFMTTQSRKILSSFHAYWGCFSYVFLAFFAPQWGVLKTTPADLLIFQVFIDEDVPKNHPSPLGNLQAIPMGKSWGYYERNNYGYIICRYVYYRYYNIYIYIDTI